MLIGILLQGLIYQLSRKRISLWNIMKNSVEKEIYSGRTILSLKNKDYKNTFLNIVTKEVAKVKQIKI